MSQLEVNITGKSKNYPIFILNNSLSELKNLIFNRIENHNYIIVFSEKVYKLYSKILDFPKDKIFILKDGENQKNIKNYQKIMNFVLSKKLNRQDFIISIGGGVVGDLTGFVASTYMRGINLIQVPTTLLSFVDSSVGGKTAINTKYGKNLVGSFYQPESVFININFLKTLDEKQYKSGLGEILKYAFIEKNCSDFENLNLIAYLNENFEKILKRDILILLELVEYCIKLKKYVVENDEKESDLRRILNFGHTYAHAIETFTKYKKYTHGHAVVCGIYFIFDFAYKTKLIDKEYFYLAKDLLEKFSYEKSCHININKLINLIKSDKKGSDEGIYLVIPESYANCAIKKYSFDEIKNIIGE